MAQLSYTGEQLDQAIRKVINDYADVSGVTAIASDVMAGKWFVGANKVLTEGTGTGGGGARLNAGTISLVGTTLSFTDGNNGSFSQNWDVYVNGTKKVSVPKSTTTCNIASYIGAGSYTIYVIVTGTGMGDSPASNSVTYDESVQINFSLTGCTWSGGTSMTTNYLEGYLVANSGYTLPSTITIEGTTGTSGSTHVTWTYNSTTGLVTLSNPTTQAIDIQAVAVVSTFSISVTIDHGTYSGSSTIAPGGTATITATATSPYSLPQTISVNGVTGTSGSVGVTWTYNSSTGVISLSSPSTNVSITIVCDQTYDYSQSGSTLQINNAPYSQSGSILSIT